MSPPAVAIELQGLRCEAGGRVLLDLPALRLQAGERVALIGPNGAGKSTLLRVLGGLAVPSAGQVQVLGRNLGDRDASALRGAALRAWRCEVAQVMQSLHLVGRLTVLENALIGGLGRRTGWADVLRGALRWPRADDAAEARQALAAVGLQALASERTDRLSGGERQKLAIARMRMQRPRLILADEPTASLDPSAAEAICRLLAETAAAPAATLITVVHHPALLPLLADRVLGLRDGRLAFDLPLATVSPSWLDDLYRGAPS